MKVKVRVQGHEIRPVVKKGEACAWMTRRQILSSCNLPGITNIIDIIELSDFVVSCKIVKLVK